MVTPEITIIGSALSGNKGASAMLESAIQTLGVELPEARFTLLSMYPREDRQQNCYENLEIVAASPRQLGVTINVLALAYKVLPFMRPLIRRRSRAIGALARSQVLLDQGGITFTDGRERFLLYNIASILPALLVGTPVVKCAQAIGPFRNPLNRMAARLFLPRMHAIVTRGAHTHAYCQGLGLTNLHPGADYAFSLEMKGTEQQQLGQEFALAQSSDTTVGVSPSVVLRKKIDARQGDYVGQMVAFIDHLTSSGRNVMLLPHSVRTGTSTTHNNDLPLCREIFNRLYAPAQVRFIDRELPSQQLRYLIGQCDVFVASRFHAMVSALAMAVPTLVIGWSHKYQEVLEMFRSEMWALPHEDLDVSRLVDRFEQLETAKGEVSAGLAEHLPAVKQKSHLQVALIATLVRSRLSSND